MNEAELDASEDRHSLLYRFWSLWLAIWSACRDPFDVGM